jgi:hypothetical protein
MARSVAQVWRDRGSLLVGDPEDFDLVWSSSAVVALASPTPFLGSRILVLLMLLVAAGGVSEGSRLTALGG